MSDDCMSSRCSPGRSTDGESTKGVQSGLEAKVDLHDIDDALRELWEKAEGLQTSFAEDVPAPRAYCELCLAVAELEYTAEGDPSDTEALKGSLSSETLDELKGKGGVTSVKREQSLLQIDDSRSRTVDDGAVRWSRYVSRTPGPVTKRVYKLCSAHLEAGPTEWVSAFEELTATGDLKKIEALFLARSRQHQPTTGTEPTGQTTTGQPTGTATAIDPNVDLESRVSVDGLESVLYVSEGRFNGVGPMQIGAYGIETQSYTTETRTGFYAAKRRVDLLPEQTVEELLGRTPDGSVCPWVDIPTDLYDRIVEWAPIVSESEPLAAVLQHNLVSHVRDDDWYRKGDCVGVPIPHEKIAAAFGMVPQVIWNRGLNTGMLLELYRRHVDSGFRWSSWHEGKSKARVIKSHSIPDDIIQDAKELMLSPEDHDDWTYLINGKSANNRRWTRELREERREVIEANKPVIEPPESANRIQAYLNSLDQATFGHGGYGIFSGEVLDKGIREASTLGEEQRRDQELRKLYWLRKFPQTLYLPCDRSPRSKCEHHNQAMNLPSHILRSMYHERDYELDLSKAHLASYVPVAKREGLDLPVLEDYLDANLRGDESVLEDGDLWRDFASSTDLKDDTAARKAVKRAYSAVYGSARQNVLYRIYQEYSKLTGDRLDNFDPIEPLLSHPLMEELFSTRDKLEVIINQRGGLEDADGRLIPLSAWDKTKDKADRWRGVMSYVNASYEQKLIGELFKEAQATKKRDAYTEFIVWLYQADGVTVRMDRRVRSHHDVIGRLQSAVTDKAEKLGVPTELEVDFTPAT